VLRRPPQSHRCRARRHRCRTERCTGGETTPEANCAKDR
jgi:hypothetical protein